MKSILVTSAGNPERGSWLVRGEQLGAAIGAKVKFLAGTEDFAGHDITVVVKRANISSEQRKKISCLVLDLVDSWPQPEGNKWSQKEACGYVRRRIFEYRPDVVIFPTQKMMEDIGSTGYVSTVLYHHGRPEGLENPIREKVGIVAYEGSERYLKDWEPTIESECKKRSWVFTKTPHRLSDADIVLAVRGGEWRGYATDNWKSNIKLANCQIIRTPIIALPEAGYKETTNGGVFWVDQPHELAEAFDYLSNHNNRLAMADLLQNHSVDLWRISGQYLGWLNSL